MNMPLLDIQPPTLKFVVDLNKQSTCVVQLTNTTHHFVAFKVKTTTPKKYYVRPKVGVVAPKSSCEVSVIMKAFKEPPPPDMVCKDIFLIQSTAVPAETTDEDNTASMFSNVEGKHIEENKLGVTLVLPSDSPELSPINGSLKQGAVFEDSILKDRLYSQSETLAPPQYEGEIVKKPRMVGHDELKASDDSKELKLVGYDKVSGTKRKRKSRTAEFKELKISILKDDVPKWRPDYFRHLPEKCKRRLKKTGFSDIKPRELKHLMDVWARKQAKSTNRRGPFSIFHEGSICFLFWKIYRQEFTDLLKRCSWKTISGPIRNQLWHIICWAYASSDLVSAYQVICNLEREYFPLCTWFLSSYVNPNMLGRDKYAEKMHHCYGSSVVKALKYIAKEGIPRELREHRVFDCKIHCPPSTSCKRFKTDGVLSFDSLDKALAHLHIQPIGADVIVFEELWRPGKNIYYGPLSKNSKCEGYHALDIIAVEMFRGEQVALCKMSNGTDVGDNGYVRVSISVMFMVVCADDAGRRIVRATPKPHHLLSNFHCPYINEARRGKAPRGKGTSESREKVCSSIMVMFARREWRGIYNTLTMLNHLLVHGPLSVFNEFQHERELIEDAILKTEWIDERGFDCGLKVGNIADKVLRLLADDMFLKDARERKKP